LVVLVLAVVGAIYQAIATQRDERAYPRRMITRCEARPFTGYAQEVMERVSWWRRVFGEEGATLVDRLEKYLEAARRRQIWWMSLVGIRH
jgi:hypothetical protein